MYRMSWLWYKFTHQTQFAIKTKDSYICHQRDIQNHLYMFCYILGDVHHEISKFDSQTYGNKQLLLLCPDSQDNMHAYGVCVSNEFNTSEKIGNIILYILWENWQKERCGISYKLRPRHASLIIE